MEDTRKLSKLIRFLRKQGVLTYKTAALELVLAPDAPRKLGASKAADFEGLEIEDTNDYTYWLEQVQRANTPGMPESEKKVA